MEYGPDAEGYGMIDEDKLKRIKALTSGESVGAQPDLGPSLSDLSEKELRKLRADVDALLPVDKLVQLDMHAELMAQYRTVQDLQDETLNDPDCPPNYKAQVAGQVASTMQHLIKMQADFYNTGRFRAIENLMIQYMKKLPLKDAHAFLEAYEKIGSQDE